MVSSGKVPIGSDDGVVASEDGSRLVRHQQPFDHLLCEAAVGQELCPITRGGCDTSQYKLQDGHVLVVMSKYYKRVLYWIYNVILM